MRKRKRKRKRYNEKEIGREEDREIGSKKRKVEVIIMSQRVVEENTIKYHGVRLSETIQQTAGEDK